MHCLRVPATIEPPKIKTKIHQKKKPKKQLPKNVLKRPRKTKLEKFWESDLGKLVKVHQNLFVKLAKETSQRKLQKQLKTAVNKTGLEASKIIKCVEKFEKLIKYLK